MAAHQLAPTSYVQPHPSTGLSHSISYFMGLDPALVPSYKPASPSVIPLLVNRPLLSLTQLL